MEITKEVTDVLENLRNRFGDDLVQEAYLFAMEYEGEVTNLKGFLGKKLNHWEWNERHVESNRRRLEIEAGLTTAVPETAPDPLDLLLFEEELGETLKGFSDLIRETLNQYYVLGWSPQEIADFNLEGVEAVRKRITRGRDLWKNFHTCETTGE
jgi:DNA-directed RNA polymerase specialized sigma24 family protein